MKKAYCRFCLQGLRGLDKLNRDLLLKANKYEKFVFNTFRNLLQKDRLLVNSKKSKVIFHPKYYSQDRRAYITFDVAIETRLNRKDKKPCF